MAPTGQVTHEGLPIPKKNNKLDRITFVLIGILQLVAVGIIVTQLKSFGLIPAWVNTDTTSFYKLVPRNPFFLVPCGHLDKRNLLILSRRVVFDHSVEPGAIHTKRGTFRRVTKQSMLSPAELEAWIRTVESTGGQVIDYGDLVVSPGVIDVHAHINEPGRLHWEGIIKGTSAASAGGITTLVDMPLNCKPAITTAKVLQRKVAKVWEKSKIDMAFWGGLVAENANDHGELNKMLEAGALGLKGFMSPSGMDDFSSVTQRDIESALPVLMRHRKALYLHAEVVADVDGTCDAGCNPRSHSSWASTRPESFEVAAGLQIITALRFARDAYPDLWHNATEPGSSFRVHIAHLASAEAVPMYLMARDEGLPISMEVTPHHITFTADSVPDGATVFKCAPPLRDEANRAELIEAVSGGAISIVASDHSPSHPRLKELASGDFLKAWGGIAGLQYILPALNTIGQREGWSYSKLASLLSQEPAKMAGLAHKKGFILPGYDADLVVWDPAGITNTTKEGCFHKHKESAYRDVPLMGVVEATFVRGAQVYSAEKGLYEKRLCGSAVLVKESNRK